MYAKFRVTECVLDPKIVKNFLGGSAPEPPAGYPFSDVRASAVLGESLPSAASALHYHLTEGLSTQTPLNECF